MTQKNKILVPRKLEPFLSKKKRYKIAFGGRGGAKSNTIADLLLMKAMAAKRIGCFREYQNSIDDSVHRLLSDEVTRLKLPGFDPTQQAIKHISKGEFKFKGLSRGLEAVKSMEGFDIFWVEEAQFLSENSIRILTPTLRTEGSEIWMSLNPGSSGDPMSKQFLNPYWDQLQKDGYYEDDLHIIIKINYNDNPWFPDVLEQERRKDYQMMDRALYRHIWEGEFNDTVDHAIIKAEWFDACIDAHIKLGFKPEGAIIVSHDPSDGGDNKGLCLRHGSVLLDVQEKLDGNVNEGCDWALDYAIEHHADVFTWDCDGMGIALQAQVEKALQGKHIQQVKFKGSQTAENPKEIYQKPDEMVDDESKQFTNKETFGNKRAQYYIRLANRIFNTYLAVEKGKYIDPEECLSISSNITNLAKVRSEVCRIPRKHLGSGRIYIMDKPEMKRLYKIDSPGLADSIMQSCLLPENPAHDTVAIQHQQQTADDTYDYYDV